MSVTTIPSQPQPGQSGKLFYVDNIKVILTVLVVLHHTFITYGASGGWYYTEKTTIMAALIPMTMFVSLNQSFFMGFFFLLAAYFTGPSYDRKGPGQFISDRLLRLGIPLLFYSFVLSPLLSYLVYYFAKGHHITLLQYLSGYDNWIDLGVMWFAAALLVFTLAYVMVRSIIDIKFKKPLQAPGVLTILICAAGTGVISFLIRIIFPVGWVLKPLGFQLGHFTQYIVLFIAGLLAYRNQWFEGLSAKSGRRMALSAWLCLLFFPLFFIIRVKTNMPIEWYSGGLHWQSLLYAIWEQWIGFSILTALLSRGKRNWNFTSALLGRLGRSAFAVYIFHPLVIVGLSLAVRNWSVDPATKLLVIAPLALLGSLVLGGMIVRIPGVNRLI